MDTASDYLAWEAMEPVEIEIPTRSGPRTLSVPLAKRRAIRGREKSPSGGVYQGYEIRWHIPARMLPGDARPEPAWVVIDSEGTRWTALTADRNKFGQTHSLGCVNLTLALQLKDTIEIQRATLASDAAGAPVKQFPPFGGRVLFTVAARVQQITEQVAVERGQRYARGRYDVTVDRQMTGLDIAEDRIRWVEGDDVRYLDLASYRAPERIDELPVIEAERR